MKNESPVFRKTEAVIVLEAESKGQWEGWANLLVPRCRNVSDGLFSLYLPNKKHVLA